MLTCTPPAANQYPRGWGMPGDAVPGAGSPWSRWLPGASPKPTTPWVALETRYLRENC